MIAYDATFKQLPLDPHTILRGMASIDGHPNRKHMHISYQIRHTDQLFTITESIVKENSNPRKKSRSIDFNNMGAYNDIVLPSP